MKEFYSCLMAPTSTRLFINASIDEDSKLYFMTTTLEINDESPDTQVKTLGGRPGGPRVFVGWDVPYMVAVTLHRMRTACRRYFTATSGMIRTYRR